MAVDSGCADIFLQHMAVDSGCAYIFLQQLAVDSGCADIFLQHMAVDSGCADIFLPQLAVDFDCADLYKALAASSNCAHFQHIVFTSERTGLNSTALGSQFGLYSLALFHQGVGSDCAGSHL